MKKQKIPIVRLSKIAITSLIMPLAFLNNTAFMSSEPLGVADLLSETNYQRQINGAGALSLSPKLSMAAQTKADDMLTEGYWSHNSLSGKTPWYFVRNSGYQYDKAGENLAKNYYESSAVVAAWLNSSSHRQNMLDKDYTEAGFASRSGTMNGQAVTITVALYAKPVSGPAVLASRDNFFYKRVGWSAALNRGLTIAMLTGVVSYGLNQIYQLKKSTLDSASIPGL